MLGTILIVLLAIGAVVGGFLIYERHKATVDREAARIVAQADAAAEKLKTEAKRLKKK